MKTPEDMRVGTVHKTRHFGDIVVVAYNGRSNVTVKSIITGEIKTANASNIRRGAVGFGELPVVAPNGAHVGSLHKSNSGLEFEIIDYKKSTNVTVRFVTSGFVTTTQIDSIRKGKVKDKLSPSKAGVGFIGVGEYTAERKGKDSDCYRRWANIIDRCYKETSVNYKNYGGNGVKVCAEWHNFQNFAKWYYENMPKDGGVYQIDKDILVEGNKVYGPDACMFVTIEENTEKANSKRARLISPDGMAVEVYNISKFCRENGLTASCVIAMLNGYEGFNSHKGWTKAI